MAEESTDWADRFSDRVDSVVEPVSTKLNEWVFYEIDVFGAGVKWIVMWLVLAGIIFTVYFGLAQLRHLGTALRIVRGKYEQKDAPGEVSHFQALTSALSGTVGLGNIAGVAIAISIGGPGAVFWMIVCGLLGMAIKFAECTLGVKYREVHADGTVSGGPMHYLRKGLAEIGLPKLGKVLAALSAIMILAFTFFGGNLFQVNQSLIQLSTETGGEDSFFSGNVGALFYGAIVAALVAVVLIGGIKSIGRLTSRLVPAMGLLYAAACLVVILWNITAVPDAVVTIFTEAFNPNGVAGGVLGALVVGFQRAAFSNEAGIGSAPIAHSAVKTKRPATEGLVAMLEPFVDTVVICTMTALTIVIANTEFWNQAKGAYVETGERADGVTVTSSAFETVLPWFPYVLTVAVIAFAVSTMITWAYYGQKSWTYLFGKSKGSERAYQLVYCSFIVIGAVLTFGSVLDFTDAVLFLFALVNIAGLYLLAPVVKRELNSFLGKVRSGELPTADAEAPTPDAAR
jgi:alanine or glycine:cation symporter, AGCS family